MLKSAAPAWVLFAALLSAACASPPKPTPGALELARNPRAAAEGRVVDREGRPVAGIAVTAIPRGRDIVWPAPATTDSDGRFVLTLYAPAQYAFFLSRDGRAVITSEADDPCRVLVTVQPGERRDGIVLVFLADAWTAASP
jgi:Carboxypeptidase regulatory-like domain